MLDNNWEPVGDKLAKALDPESYHNSCDLCKGPYIPDINGDSLTCDSCLFTLAKSKRFEVVFNRIVTGETWKYLQTGATA